MDRIPPEAVATARTVWSATKYSLKDSSSSTADAVSRNREKSQQVSRRLVSGGPIESFSDHAADLKLEEAGFDFEISGFSSPLMARRAATASVVASLTSGKGALGQAGHYVPTQSIRARRRCRPARR